jgi:hypothetical protein
VLKRRIGKLQEVRLGKRFENRRSMEHLLEDLKEENKTAQRNKLHD